MHSLHDHALVLKRDKHLDNDLKLTLLLRQSGKVFVVAKSVRKNNSKLRAIAEPFIEAEVHLMLPHHGVTGRLINGRILNSHPHIRSNYHSFSVAARCAEVVQELLPNRVPSPGVYDILRASFQALKHPETSQTEWIVFVSTLLHHLGHGDITTELKGKPLNKCLTLVARKLENHLQRRLKSEVLNLHDIPRTHFFA